MRNKLTDELAVCGFNAVTALGEQHPDTINRLFLRQDRFMSFTKVCKKLAARKRPYKVCDDEELERICKSPRHQGVVAMIIEPETANLTRDELETWAAEGKTGILLFDVGNDHNLGAIIRSAAFFGIDYCIISDTDQAAQITTSAYRVAEGGMEYVAIRKVRNVPPFLRDASQCLTVLGADHRARQRIRDVPAIVKAHKPGVLVVVGNEEKGIPQDIKENCTALVRVPGTGNIESLNVAQAATLFLHELFEI